MRRSSWLATFLGLAMLAGAAEARDAQGVVSPRGSVAEVKALPQGGQGVFVDGKLVWPSGDRPVTIAAPLRWERSGSALAIVAREPSRTVLSVVIVNGKAAGKTLEWEMPSTFRARAVMWLGSRKVAVGPDEMDPRVIASFDLR